MYEEGIMKPLHIALLLAAGAVGGVVIMKVSQRPEPGVVAESPVPTAAPETAPTPAPNVIADPVTPAVPAVESPKPSPVAPAKGVREAPRPAAQPPARAPGQGEGERRRARRPCAPAALSRASRNPLWSQRPSPRTPW